MCNLFFWPLSIGARILFPVVGVVVLAGTAVYAIVKSLEDKKEKAE